LGSIAVSLDFKCVAERFFGNSYFLNFLVTGSFLLTLACCSYFVVSLLFNPLQQTKLANPRRHPGIFVPSLPASSEQPEVNEVIFLNALLLCPISAGIL